MKHHKFVFGLLLFIAGCYEVVKPISAPTPATTQAAVVPATTQPSIAPLAVVTEHPVTKAVVDGAATVNTVAGTVQALTPPGNSVHDWATIIMAVSGAVIASNEMLKRVGGNKSTDTPPASK